MLKTDALKYYGTPTAVAEALGITVQAVSLWGEVVPEGRAYQLQVLTNGELPVNPALYHKRVRAAVIPQPAN